MLPPSRPTAIAVIVNKSKLEVKWQTGPESEFSGGPPTGIRIYRSINGYGFDGGLAAEVDADSSVIDPLTTDSATFVRVTALNSAGESLPSQTVAAYAGAQTGKNAAERANNILLSPTFLLDRSVNVPYPLDRQPGGPYRDGAETQRVRPLYAMMEPAGRAEAEAMAALGEAFDGADTAAVEAGTVDLAALKRVLLVAETYAPGNPLLSEKVRRILGTFLENNGKVYIAGTGVAQNISAQGSSQNGFLRDVLGVTATEWAPAAPGIASTDARFLPTTTTVHLKETVNFWNNTPVQPAAFEISKGRSIPLLQYNSQEGKAAAVLTRPTYSEGEIFFFGFPLSLVNGSDQRNALMQALLKQM